MCTLSQCRPTLAGVIALWFALPAVLFLGRALGLDGDWQSGCGQRASPGARSESAPGDEGEGEQRSSACTREKCARHAESLASSSVLHPGIGQTSGVGGGTGMGWRCDGRISRVRARLDGEGEDGEGEDGEGGEGREGGG